jgi:hypothetical protein
MKREFYLAILIFVAASLPGFSISAASDVKVMYAVGLLETGENAKLLTADEFNQSAPDYEKFKDRLSKATTLREMTQQGWTIVHVESIKGGDPYRQQNHLFIFQRSRRQ